MIDTSRVIDIHGILDTVAPFEPVREIVRKRFTDVKYYVVKDDHRLYKSVHELDWIQFWNKITQLISGGRNAECYQSNPRQCLADRWA